MPNTFTQIYIHVVFAVQNRNALIKSEWENELYQYITGVIQNNKNKLLAINGMPDHIHFLIGMNPNCNLSNLIKDIKISSNKFINENHSKYKFKWQEGYGAFSYNHSMLNQIIKYIKNQKLHHKKKTFKDEYKEILHKFSLEYNEKYLFDWLN